MHCCQMIDFLVIGGGIAGISVAARLSEDGSCKVLEREAHLAYHTSGRSAALYEENYGSPSTIALAKAGHADWDNLLAGVLSPRGFMLLCLRGEERESIHRSRGAVEGARFAGSRRSIARALSLIHISEPTRPY